MKLYSSGNKLCYSLIALQDSVWKVWQMTIEIDLAFPPILQDSANEMPSGLDM